MKYFFKFKIQTVLKLGHPFARALLFVLQLRGSIRLMGGPGLTRQTYNGGSGRTFIGDLTRSFSLSLTRDELVTAI